MAAARGINYPAPIVAPERAYNNPKPSNPTLSGLPLKIISEVVSKVPPLQSFLYSNVGFPLLSKVEAEGVLNAYSPRFDPTVIPHPSTPSAAPTTQQSVPPSPKNPIFYSSRDLVAAYSARITTPSEIAKQLFSRIDRAKNGTHCLGFISTDYDLLVKAANYSTLRYQCGAAIPGGLDGVFIAVKDDIDVEGYQTTQGMSSAEAEKRKTGSGGTSWCVQKLMDAGAIVLGKANMHELGLDTTNNNPNWGTPRNPYNKDYYPGGSSGGSAFAVGSGLVPIAVGGDGGGSVRIPANYCGVYGLKTTHGRVSEHPTVCPCPNVAVRGPIAATMYDLELAYRVMATPDPENGVSGNFPAPLSNPSLPTNKTLGIFKPWFDDCDPEVLEITRDAISSLEKCGYKVVDITLPFLFEARLSHALTILSEISTSSHPAGLTPANKILVSITNSSLSHHLIIAQKIRSLIMSHLSSLFLKHPDLIIISPVTPHVGIKVTHKSHTLEAGAGLSDSNTSLRSMIYAFLANFTGIPSINFPVGYSKEEGLPVGLMGCAEWGGEENLLALGREGEKILGNQRRRGEGWVDVLEKK